MDEGSGLLGRDYWLVLSTPGPTTAGGDIKAMLADHLEWLLGLETRGAVLMSGPLTEGPGTGPGSGVTVLRARDFAAATAIAEADPFVVAGLRTYQIFKWQVNEGSVGITVSLGTGTYTWQ
jgi:uncharacterized protein YciI